MLLLRRIRELVARRRRGSRTDPAPVCANLNASRRQLMPACVTPRIVSLPVPVNVHVLGLVVSSRSLLANTGFLSHAASAEFARSIIESLAEAFAGAVRIASILSGVDVETIHIVGGGALNELLCQRTADRAGLPVLAGPVEATAIGNVLVQARAQGFTGRDLESLRALVAAAFTPVRYEPQAGGTRG